jgi:membrane protease YdiL (CAAX protease family)
MIDPAETSADVRLWTGLRALAVFAAWIGGGIVGGVVLAAAGVDVDASGTGTAVVIAAQAVGAFAAVVAFSRRAGNGDLGQDVGLGLRPRELWGILGGMGLQIAVALLLSPIAIWLDAENQQQAVADVAEQTSDAAGVVLLFVSFVVVAPIAEEVLFRGVILRSLLPRLGVVGAVVVQALVFAGLHWDPSRPEVIIPVIGLVVVGLVFGFLAAKRGSLGLPIMLHAGVNLLAYVGLVFADELEEWLRELESSIETAVRLFG